MRPRGLRGALFKSSPREACLDSNDLHNQHGLDVKFLRFSQLVEKHKSHLLTFASPPGRESQESAFSSLAASPMSMDNIHKPFLLSMNNVHQSIALGVYDVSVVCSTVQYIL
jgi:hypothetical protein